MTVTELKNFINYKIVCIRFKTIIPENIAEDMEVEILYNVASDSYSMQLEGRRYGIEPATVESMKEHNEYSRYFINSSVEREGILYLHRYRFAQCIVLSVTQSLKITIDTSLFENLKKGKESPVVYLERLFIMQSNHEKREVFLLPPKDKNNISKFTLLSGSYCLDIKREQGVYSAYKLRRYRGGSESVSSMKGDIYFTESARDILVDDAVRKMMESLNNEGKYTAVWKRYDELELLLCIKKAIKGGVYEYRGYEPPNYTNGMMYAFNVFGNCEEPDENTDFDITENTLIKDIYNDSNILKISNVQNMAKAFEGKNVGQFKRLQDGVLYIASVNEYAKKLPQSGYLFCSVKGDTARISRREQAQKLIGNHGSGVPHMNELLNNGAHSAVKATTHIPVTEDVRRKLKDSDGNPLAFNEAQLRAIDIAINTPDIALIQGPPGTGKTTVIRAIVARFEEIYKKRYDGALPKILVTSFQHDAVENAIARIETLGLPVNRVGGRRNDENRSRLLGLWLDSMSQHLDKRINELANLAIFNEIEELKRRRFAWWSKGRNISEGIELLRQYFDYESFEISSELRRRVDSVMMRQKSFETNDNPMTVKIKQLAASLRTSKLSFDDDGIENLRDYVEIRAMLEPSYEPPAFLFRVIDSEGDDVEAFKLYLAYVGEINGLNFSYITDATLLDEEVNMCLFELINEKERLILLKIENIETAKAKILNDYKNSIFGEIEKIVKKYSSVQASTCQQTMTGKSLSEEDMFDLVVIDEAARANPSDLFIPLCLGRKIVMVGDQKQLPHMLEPDVLQELEQIKIDEKDKMINYRQSLFERMFNIFNETSIVGQTKRTYSLNEQYRMTKDLSDFVRDKIYLPNVDLMCATDVQPYDIEMYQCKAMVWVEVGSNYGIETRGRSKSRDIEARILVEHLRKLIKRDDIDTIGIITFYAAQRDLIKRKVDAIGLTHDESIKIEIGTVDAFQGKEFDVVLLSCTRSNKLPINKASLVSKVGFLDDNSRVCVAISRAKRLLVIIGDSETVCAASVFGDYIHECKSGKGCFIHAK